MAFERRNVSYLDVLVPIAPQVLDLARQIVSLCWPLHKNAIMHPHTWRFCVRNLFIYIMLLGFATKFSHQHLLSLLPLIVASAVCTAVPASGLFLEEGDRSVVVLYTFWCWLWIVIFPQPRMSPKCTITDFHTDQPFYSVMNFEHLQSLPGCVSILTALASSDYFFLYLVSNPKAELGNFAQFHSSVQAGVLGVVTVLKHFVNGFQEAWKLTLQLLRLVEKWIQVPGEAPSFQVSVRAGLLGVAAVLSYFVNGFQEAWRLTFEFLLLFEEWMKVCGEMVSRKSLEDTQASDTPPPYFVSFQAPCFMQYHSAYFRTWHAESKY